MTSATNYTFEAMIERATEIREVLPYLNNLPADTAELVDGLILRLEVAHARGLHRKLAREAEQAAVELEAEAELDAMAERAADQRCLEVCGPNDCKGACSERKPAETVLEREAAWCRAEAAEAVKEAKAAKLAAKPGKARGKVATVDLGDGHFAVVTPGRSIRLYGLERNRRAGPVDYDRTFEIGDTVAMDSYNLVYTGQITSIGAKTVTIKGNLGTKRLNLERFSWFNRLFDLEETARRNAETRLTI